MQSQHPQNTYELRENPLQRDLDLLQEKYGEYLKQEFLTDEVLCLRGWLESYQRGSSEAAEYLQEYGASILNNITDKLQRAADEMQRIDAESPGGKNFSGGKADRLVQAAELADKAKEELQEVIETQIK